MSNNATPITLIHSREPLSAQWNQSGSRDTRIIIVPNWNAFREGLLVGLTRDERHVERVIIDQAIPHDVFIDFLTALPVEFRGDVLYIENNERAILSAAMPREGRILYSLKASDLAFYLATADLRVASVDETEEGVAAQDRVRRPSGNRVMLIADDDRRSRERLAAVAAAAGCEAVYACNGLEAIRLAGELRPGIIFLDGLMPSMHGFEVARFIRRLDSDYCPVISIVTAIYKSLRYRNDAKLKYGVDRYFTKPIDVAQSADFVRSVLQRELTPLERRLAS